ncbi:MAG: segregation/condensation protein A [Verrucomicrobia bacterium]|nr:segregation/condensation protein A [Verrucomicrobiota bacterium]
MLNPSKQQFNLDRFEGPLELLLHLVQKSELDISDLPLAELTRQFLMRLEQTELNLELNQGGDFLVTTSSLLLMKSRALLPKENNSQETPEEDPDPRFEMLSQVVEYCRLQEAARTLSQLEEKEAPFFGRASPPITEEPRFKELEPLCPEELSEQLEKLLKRSAEQQVRLLKEDSWNVHEAMQSLLTQVQNENGLPCLPLFSAHTSHTEWIVLFLALLELIKGGKIRIDKDKQTGELFLLCPTS